MADGGSRQLEWRVTGMDCGACASKVRGAVERLPGVAELDEARTPPERVEGAVRALGFGIAPKGTVPEKPKGGFVLPDGAFPSATAEPTEKAAPRAHAADEPAPKWYATAKGRLVLGTGALLAAAWAVRLGVSAEAAHWAFAVATLIGLVPIARRAVAMARVGMPFTIEMLMTIAAAGALVIGAAEETALVVFLFAVGEMLEGLAANKARDGIRALAQLVPRTALLEVGGGTRAVPAGKA